VGLKWGEIEEIGHSLLASKWVKNTGVQEYRSINLLKINFTHWIFVE
jgi:hypothetical protein